MQFQTFRRLSSPLWNTRVCATAVALCVAATVSASPSALAAADASTASAATAVGTLPLLSDPFLQLPGRDSVVVVWNTAFRGSTHVVLVGNGVASLSPEQTRSAAAGGVFPDVRVVVADSRRYSRMAEDSSSRLPDGIRPLPEDGIVAREAWRHEATVDGLPAGVSTPYRVVSLESDGFAASGAFRLAPAPKPGDGLRILLTSDHQAMANTPANLQMAAETIGEIDAVFLAGDLVNQPDRASEWFDDTRGSAFLATLQGRGGRVDNNGVKQYRGGEIIQNAPLFPAVGNHEVQGRIDGMTSIGTSYNSPVPIAVAEAAYEKVAATINPSGDPAIRAQWVEDNSFSTTTYEEIFTLPKSTSGGETYYATTFGDVRLISLYSTRIWRGTTATADPAARTASSRYQESSASITDPLGQGYGEHVFESLEEGSPQYEWLEQELASDEFADARFRIVMLHEGPQGLGDNVMPHFANPVRIEEKDASGVVVGVRYEYPANENMLLTDLTPLLEASGVDLVHNGHSHLWNRFVSQNGVNYLETSNTGNSYGAYHPLSGQSRPIPPAPWDAANYLAQGNPGGLTPVVPNVEPFFAEDGAPFPFVQSNDLAVFAMLDTGRNEVVSYAYDVRTPDREPWVIDRFSLGRMATEPTASPEPSPSPTLSPEPTPSLEPTTSPEPSPGPTLTPGATAAPSASSAPVPSSSVTGGGTLPVTGGPVLPWMVAVSAAALIAAGAALALVRRRRSEL